MHNAFFFFFSSRRRHTRFKCDWSSDVCSSDLDVLLVAVGAFGGLAVEAASRLAAQGIGVTVVDPRWALPVPPEIGALASEHRLVVTVEDGGRSGGVGAAVVDRLAG